MLEFIHGIHLIVSLMLLYLLLNHYSKIKSVLNSACLKKCFNKGSDSS